MTPPLAARPALLALLLPLALATPAALVAEAAARPPRPVVLVLHGRGMGGQDTASLRRAWLGALNDGLSAAESPLRLGEEDLRLVWYADALDPRTGGACRPGKRGEAERAASRNQVGSWLGVAGAVLALAAEWSGDRDAEPLRSVAGDLLYFGDDRKRCAAEERLSSALSAARLEGRPVILVAHSFGSWVAYNHVRERAEDAPPVERWVTVGSLVGFPELRELLLGPDAHVSGLPAGVRGWVNVRDPDDPLAAPLRGLGETEGLTDTVTAAAHDGDSHDAARYLADPVTAGAVLEGWCAAVVGWGAYAGACDADGTPAGREGARVGAEGATRRGGRRGRVRPGPSPAPPPPSMRQ